MALTCLMPLGVTLCTRNSIYNTLYKVNPSQRLSIRSLICGTERAGQRKFNLKLHN